MFGAEVVHKLGENGNTVKANSMCQFTELKDAQTYDKITFSMFGGFFCEGIYEEICISGNRLGVFNIIFVSFWLKFIFNIFQ